VSAQPKEGDWSLIKRLWVYAAPDARLYFLAIASAPLSMALALVQPLLIKAIIDDHVTTGEMEGLGTLAAYYLAAVVAAFLLQAAYTLAVAFAGQRTIYRMREAVYQHLIAMSAAFFDTRPAGALLTRATSDVESLGETLQGQTINIVLDVLMVVGVLVSMFVMDWRLTLFMLGIAPVVALVLEVCRRRLRALFGEIRNSISALNAFLAERLNGVEVVQLFNHQGPTGARFDALNLRVRDATIRSNLWDAFMFAAVDGLGSVCLALMFWYSLSDFAGLGGPESAITAGLLVAFADYLERLFRPLRQFSNKMAVIQRAAAALEKIFGLLDDDRRISPGEPDAAPAKLDGRIIYKDVRFAYKEGEDVLKGVSFEVSPGQVVALVGPTGCGKTTVTRLLSRTYDGYRGSISIDGVELDRLPPATVRGAVVAVAQDLHLFPETVRFNVDLGDERLSLTDLEAAATLTHAAGFIDELPEGWDTVLQERGGNLSVGQAQLLTFARTMAHDPAVIVLDEATASIDPVTERLVQDAIARILERKTVIVVAHRLSTITAADQILVMDRGEVAERGTHEELLSLGGRYAALYEAGFSEHQ